MSATGDLVTVVLADDLPEIRLLVRSLLETDGRFQVVAEASTGREILEAVERLRPDAAIVDLAMPQMDGLEAIPRLLNTSPETKVLVLSGFDATQMAAVARRQGAHDYIEKGTDLRDVVMRLAALFPDIGPAPHEGPAPRHPEARERGAVEEILNVLIHELQTPLAVLEGFALALQTAVERDDPQAIQETAEAIKRSSRTMRSLIRSFADTRALEAGRLSLTTRPAEVVKLVQLTLDDIKTVTHGHQLRVIAEKEFTVEVDSVRVRQILTNLVGNAVKFSPPGSPIDVLVRPGGGGASIAVRDRGPGIPSQRLNELFKKFSRLGVKGTGTGLGLYLSRGIARAHGGDLTVESVEGGGSTFTLTLPGTPLKGGAVD